MDQQIDMFTLNFDTKNNCCQRSTRLVYTGLRGTEHLKIESRLMDERFASVRVCDRDVLFFFVFFTRRTGG